MKLLSGRLADLRRLDVDPAIVCDAYGTAQAFAAAGRPRPLIMLGNRQDELAWWKEQKDHGGYDSWSASEAPGMVTFAFWVAQQILDGQAVPQIELEAEMCGLLDLVRRLRALHAFNYAAPGRVVHRLISGPASTSAQAAEQPRQAVFAAAWGFQA